MVGGKIMNVPTHYVHVTLTLFDVSYCEYGNTANFHVYIRQIQSSYNEDVEK